MHKKRIPWLAGVLNFLDIGLGHLYAGQLKKGLILFFISQILFALLYLSLLLGVYAAFFIFFLVFVFFVYCIYDAAKLAKAAGHNYTLKNYNKWYYYFSFLILASAFTVFGVEYPIETFIVKTYKAPSGSMKPTLQIGDHFVVNNLFYKWASPARKDIVIFPFPEDPSKDFVKRIVAMAGDTIEIRDKSVMINGTVIDEPYAVHTDPRVLPEDVTERDNFGPFHIPPDTYFVMGDNRDNSHDSRFWGIVKKEDIKGKAIQVYWSWDKEHFSVRWDRIGKHFSEI